MNNDRSRYELGEATLRQVDGQAGEDVVATLGDLGTYIVEFAFGDIYQRGAIDLKEREMITIAILTVLGRETQLRVHLGAARNVGLSQEEIEETILQTVPYAGFPTAINAMKMAKDMSGDRRNGYS